MVGRKGGYALRFMLRRGCCTDTYAAAVAGGAAGRKVGKVIELKNVHKHFGQLHVLKGY